MTATLPSPAAAHATADYTQKPAYWRGVLKEYARPRLGLALLSLVTSLGGYLAVSTGIYFLLHVSIWLGLAASPIAAAFLLRTFIVFHDCGHSNFFASRRANQFVGRVCALIVMAPFSSWRHDHNVHHATAGDLDKRGIGDVPCMTLAEYRSKDAKEQRMYRIFRNPAIMFTIGPIVAMIIGPRLPGGKAPGKARNSVLLTDAGIAITMGLLIWLMGVAGFFLVWAPAALISGAAGVWLFYVQHQFEDVYMERGSDWNYADAALRGSSFLNLPQPLAWATGYIGYHHIHHLSSKVPSYSLARTHREVEAFQSVPTLTMMDGFRCTKLKVYDETTERMLTWAEVRALEVPAGAPVAAPWVRWLQ